MSECHFCSLLSNESGKTQNDSFMAQCCKKRCNNKFCLKCIREKFDPNFQQCSYKRDTWICYSCQSLCSCLLCKGIGSQKKAYKKKSNNKSVDPIEPEQSINTIKSSDINQNYFKEEELSNKPIFMRKILEKKNLMYRLMFEASENDEGEEKKKQKKVQSSGKDTNKLRKLISETMKNYEDDELDIELIN